MTERKSIAARRAQPVRGKGRAHLNSKTEGDEPSFSLIRADSRHNDERKFAMNTRELPPHPSLEHFKKQAKDLLKSVQSGHPEALLSILQRIQNDHPRLGRLAELEPQRTKLRLADVQSIIARDYGFESWPRFAKHLRGLTVESSAVSRFESAVDTVVNGEVEKLKRLLRENPELAQERSARLHHATLLHYVGANGVENYRQKTPKNAVEIAEVLIGVGADINAVADIYGGSDTLGLAATSVFPAQAGVQDAIIDTLLKHGASLGGERLVNSCLANGRGKAAEHLAKRGAPLDLEGSAGVGRLDLVQSFFSEDGNLKSNATQRQKERGFIWACEYGRTAVVEFLLQKGLSPEAAPRGATGLHWAAFMGHIAIVKLLLERKAPLAVKDKNHGGTPLEWAVYAWDNPSLDAEHDGYYDVVALLAAAGGGLDPAWLNSPGRSPIMEKLRRDPRMTAALKGEMQPQ